MIRNVAAHNAPQFLIIGAQKGGTTWLWNMIAQHPGVDLPREKEIHYFGSAELYRRGRADYYRHFDGLDRSKVTGEASTSYFYDRVPYWYNDSRELKLDLSLPPIPELITAELPGVKVLVVLRDPVARAVSAYFHWMRSAHRSDRDPMSPLLGLKETALRYPKTRILEYGYYAEYLRSWMNYVPKERLRILIYEEDVQRSPRRTIAEVYRFLGLDPLFEPVRLTDRIHESWSWTRILLSYYADPVSRKLVRSRLGRAIDRCDVLGRFAIKEEDIDFLRSIYADRQPELEALLEKRLDCWRLLRAAPAAPGEEPALARERVSES